MTQLPPKVPNMSQNWPSFPHQRLPPTTPPPPTNFNGIPTSTATTTATTNQPYWADEFLNFSNIKRGNHRRSVSDSIAFLDTSIMDDVDEFKNNNKCSDNSYGGGRGGGGGGGHDDDQHNAMQDFDRLDDDQLMSMFTDDVSMSVLPHTGPTTATSSSVSSPSSDQACCNNDVGDQVTIKLSNGVSPMDHQYQTKHEPGEDDSSCKSDDLQATASNGDTIFDPKRVKRILANRQSAQRSRVRKLHYISELERSVTSLQSEVSALSPRVAFLDHQRLILNVDNSTIKQRIAALAQDKIFKDAHQDALKKEIERLRQVYHQQNLHKNNNNNNNHGSNQPPPQRSENSVVCTDS